MLQCFSDTQILHSGCQVPAHHGGYSHFQSGHWGPNDCGKSTLLKAINNEQVRQCSALGPHWPSSCGILRHSKVVKLQCMLHEPNIKWKATMHFFWEANFEANLYPRPLEMTRWTASLPRVSWWLPLWNMVWVRLSRNVSLGNLDTGYWIPKNGGGSGRGRELMWFQYCLTIVGSYWVDTCVLLPS